MKNTENTTFMSLKNEKYAVVLRTFHNRSIQLQMEAMCLESKRL